MLYQYHPIKAEYKIVFFFAARRQHDGVPLNGNGYFTDAEMALLEPPFVRGCSCSKRRTRDTQLRARVCTNVGETDSVKQLMSMTQLKRPAKAAPAENKTSIPKVYPRIGSECGSR